MANAFAIPASATLDDLTQIIERQAVQLHQLRAENDALRRRLDDLTAQNAALTDQLDQARREAARQAAPFRRRETAKVPAGQRKRPGRAAGHAGARRPVPAHVDHEIVVPLNACPQCGGAVDDCREQVQYIEELPPVRPVVTKLTTHRGVCPCCGPVASTHPLQTGSGHHASGAGLGPRALAVAAALNKQNGLSMRKTCRVLRDLCGLRLSPGGLSQALDRLADRLDPEYQQLFADVRAGPAVYVDETSWWVGGPGHWLWVFTNPATTLYQVRDCLGSAVVTETLTAEYAGTLVSDCLNVYDAAPAARKHKCIAHHQKAIREQLDTPGLRDRAYLEAWRSFFRQVSAVWRCRANLPPGSWEKAKAFYAARRDELLNRPVSQPADERIRHRLLKQQPHLLGCLDHPDHVEPTNNRAERALRPAVIARKISSGNKTERGKTTWERIASITATLAQRGKDVLGELAARCSLLGKKPPC